MRSVLGTGGLAALILWVAATGCNKNVVREKPLPDPLLTSKKPVEGKPHLSDPGPAVREEMPTPPPPPFQIGGPTSGVGPPVLRMLPGGM